MAAQRTGVQHLPSFAAWRTPWAGFAGRAGSAGFNGFAGLAGLAGLAGGGWSNVV